jgi:hypothetical protein
LRFIIWTANAIHPNRGNDAISNFFSIPSGPTLILALLAALLSGSPNCLAQIQSTPPSSATSLHAGALSLNLDIAGNRFTGLHVHDAISGHTIDIPEAFVLVLKDKTILRSTNMQIAPASGSAAASDPHRSLRGPHQSSQPPTNSCWSFSSSKTTASLQWCVVVRPHTSYARQLLAIAATTKDLPLAEVRLLQFADPAAHVDGSVKGSPIVDANMFYGFEHPLSSNTVQNGEITSSLFRDLPLRAGQSITYSSVIGTSSPGQLRRAFLTYIENERPRPYRPFLHYNSWFDLGYGNRFDESGALDRINAFGRQLTVARHVQLDSFLFDDGWDDPHTLWGFDSGFPHGFTAASAAAARYKAGIGIWLSPWGGYDEQKKQRIAYGREHGYEILHDGYALSGPKYFQKFEATCLEMIDRYHVNQFKFDGTGNADSVFPGSAFDSDFDAAIHLIERIRHQQPSIFVNLTTGTTASPFWLFYADSIWRGGDDHAFSGEGTPRQRWITYRDAQTYKNIVLQGPLFPLNSLMLHGIVYATQAKDLATDPGSDFADEVHSYFGSGTQLQEMYITPSLLKPTDWDTLANAARWSRAHAETLKDVHWIGGDPDQSQIYGWAAWSSREGILTLRNPAKAPQTFNVDLATVFELQHAGGATYKLHSVWSGSKEWSRVQTIRASQPFPIHLAPFEVLTLEAIPTP